MSAGSGRLLQLLVLSLALAAGSGCGGAAGPAAEPSPSASSSQATPGTPSPGTPSPDAATLLTVVVDDGSGRTTRWTLSCAPEGGDHPDPAAACRALDQHGRTALPPLPKGLQCAQVYGGPQTATVTGTWRGQAVTSRFTRTDGCEIKRWDRMVGLLPKPTG